MAGFSYRKSLLGSVDQPTHLSFIIANSATVKVGDVVRLTTAGFAKRVAAGEGVLGVVAGVVDKNGIRIDPDANTLDTYTVASDNQTVAQKKVQVIPALPHYLFYNDANGDLATTNLLQYADLVDEDQVNASSVTDTFSAQVQIVELDPDGDADASKVLVRFVETQIGSDVGVNNAA